MDEEPKEPTRKPVGMYRTDQELFELGFDGIFSYFIRYDFKQRGWRKVIEIPINEDLIFVPLCDDLIRRKVIHLPSAPEPYGQEQELYRLVRHFIHHHVAVSEFYERLATYYVLFTWLYDRFNTLPYLRTLGDYGTGKSRFLQTIGAICYRPVFASGATTVSPIFRIIDMHQGTLIIDEGDFKNSDSDAEIIKILCCGYQDGFPVIRSEPRGNSFQPIAYNVYGPKLIATRKRFTDKALESRCLTEEMDFQWRANIPHILPDTFWNDALEIRNRLLQWRFDKYQQVRLRHDLINESIEPRLNQVMMPLASIINDQCMLTDLREFAEAYNKNIVTERGMLLEADVLQAIVDLARAGKRDPSMREISDRVNTGDDREKPVTANKVGWVVRDKLKLHKQDRRHVQHLIWDAEKIGKLCQRYGVVPEGCEDVRIVSHLGGPSRDPHTNAETPCEDSPQDSHNTLTMVTSSQDPRRPTPETCDGCNHFDQRWISCRSAEKRLQEMNRCPVKAQQPLEARVLSGSLAGERAGMGDKRVCSPTILATKERARKGIEAVQQRRRQRMGMGTK